MELFIWDGEANWCLPSMDLKSFQMLLYVQFSAAPVKITKCLNPFSAPSGTLPAFKCSDGILTDFETVSTFLRKSNYSCDHELSPRQCADVIAYQNMLEEKLQPALTYLWWVEPRSYEQIIHKWYYSHMNFPFKLWVPGSYHNDAKQVLQAIIEEPEDDMAIETEVLKRAQECLTMLSHKLGEREYFFGQTPSAIDALLLPYLALLLKVDLKQPVLQNYIKACPNLSKYVSKNLLRFFPEQTQSKSTSSDNSKPSSDDEHVPNKANFLISGLVAVIAMCGYAVATGLVQVDMGDKSGLEDTDEDYEDMYEEEDIN